MDDGAERQAVAKRSGHVGDLDVSIAQRHVLAPLLQSLNSRLPRHEYLSRNCEMRAIYSNYI